MPRKKQKKQDSSAGQIKVEKKEEAGNETKKKENTEKKEDSPPKHQHLYFTLFAAALIIILLAVIFVPRIVQKIQLNNYKYNNFEFTKNTDGFWYTLLQKNGQTFWVPFYYHPKQLEDIPVETNLWSKFYDIKNNNGSIFITIDPDANNNSIVLAAVEIARITGTRYNMLNVPTHSAFIKAPKNTSVDTGTPVVTCNQASNKTMVIWLVLSDKNIAYSNGYCVILEAKSYGDMIRVSDRLMYTLLGVMLK